MPIMQRRLIPLILLATCLVVTGGSACGSQAFSGGGETHPCVIKSKGEVSRIQPENSGLSCTTIRSILKLLPDAPGVWPLNNDEGKAVWVCREFPESALPQEVRCHQGRRHFEKVREQTPVRQSKSAS